MQNEGNTRRAKSAAYWSDANPESGFEYKRRYGPRGVRVGPKSEPAQVPETETVAIPITCFPTHRLREFWRAVSWRGRRGTDCWPWKKSSSVAGYGRFKVFGRLLSAHRIAYALARGGVPKGTGYHGAVVRHTCDNPSCCNPRHLVLGTHKDNVDDMIARGRGRHRSSGSPLVPASGGRP